MDARIIPQDFYVYLHRKATTGEVFYVGKGNGDRAWAAKSRSLQWRSTVNKHGHTVEIVQDGLQEWAAFELEVALIALYGRRDLGKGPLANLTDGGDGAAGYTQTQAQIADNRRRGAARLATPEAKAAHAAQMRAVWSDPKRRAKQAEVIRKSARDHPRPPQPASADTRAAQAAAAKARWADPAKGAAARAAVAKAASREVVCNGVLVFPSQTAAAQWVSARRAGALSLHAAVRNIQNAVARRSQGRSSTAYGYTWAYHKLQDCCNIAA